MTTHEQATTPLRWAIIGTGNIAGRFADDLRLTDAGELVAVGSRSPARAEAFAARTSAPRFHADHAELLAADDVDAVYIAVPHSAHRDMAVAAIEAGKAVLVEKPFTLNRAQADELARPRRRWSSRTRAPRGRGVGQPTELADDDGTHRRRRAIQQHASPGRASRRQRPSERLGVPVALEQAGAVRAVVVHRPQVTRRVLPPVVAHHRARGVDAPGEVVERGDEVALVGPVLDVRHAPALVERHPCDDARVAAVAPQHLEPLAGEAPDRGRGECVDAGHLAPDQQPQPVAPVQEAGVLDLLVDADAVEPEPLGELYLAAQRARVGGGEVRLRPVALLERQPQEVRPAVQQERAIGRADGAVPDVAAHPVDDATGAVSQRAVPQGHVGVEQVR